MPKWKRLFCRRVSWGYIRSPPQPLSTCRRRPQKSQWQPASSPVLSVRRDLKDHLDHKVPPGSRDPGDPQAFLARLGQPAPPALQARLAQQDPRAPLERTVRLEQSAQMAPREPLAQRGRKGRSD